MDIKVQRDEAYHDGLKVGISQGISEGINQGMIKGIIMDNLEDGKTHEEISLKLQKRFSMTSEQAEEYIRKYLKSMD